MDTGVLATRRAPRCRRCISGNLLAVPFENLDIPLGRRITLDPDALWRKVIIERRGGFCYELNTIFGRLLQALGYDVDFLSACVWNGTGWGPTRTTWPSASAPTARAGWPTSGSATRSDDGRVSVTQDRLIRTAAGHREETPLVDAAAFRRALAGHEGITLSAAACETIVRRFSVPSRTASP